MNIASVRHSNISLGAFLTLEDVCCQFWRTSSLSLFFLSVAENLIAFWAINLEAGEGQKKMHVLKMMKLCPNFVVLQPQSSPTRLLLWIPILRLAKKILVH